MPEQFSYDVFLSHSSKDKPVVRAVAERLRADGLRVWFDAWELRPGDFAGDSVAARGAGGSAARCAARIRLNEDRLGQGLAVHGEAHGVLSRL